MRKYLPALAVIFAATLWSLDGLLRQELHSVSSFLIVTLEHTIGAIVFFPILFRGRGEIMEMNQRSWISVLWIGICGGILGTFFYTKALSYVNYIDLSVVILLQKFQPFFAIALAAVILKEPITRRFLFLATMALIGGYLVTFGTNSISDWDDKTVIAALLALLAAFSWGSSTVLGKHALKRLSFPVVTALRLTITTVVALAVLLTTRNAYEVFELSGRQWLFILAIVFSTGSVALFIYYYGLKHLPATHATIYELFWPLSAVLFDWLFRGRLLMVSQYVGAILLLTAIILLTRKQSGNNV
ncbi:MAG: DMT family transporter [FCB group bacterium]|nr:DMT family transporter [FCB group bacterium]